MTSYETNLRRVGVAEELLNDTEALPENEPERRSASLLSSARTESSDLRTAIQKQSTATAFATLFVDGYLTPAFGARAKSEIDLLVLGCLIKAGAVDPGAPLYDLARALNITPSKVRALILNWQLRSNGADLNLTGALAKAVAKARFAKDGSLLTFGIENPLLREEVEARLKRRGVFADASFSREILRLPVEIFAELLDDMIDETTKREVRKRLVDDHQLPDRSFKAVIAGLLGKIGEKVAGKAGEAVAGELLKPLGDVRIEDVTIQLTALLSHVFRRDGAAAVAAFRTTELA